MKFPAQLPWLLFAATLALRGAETAAENNSSPGLAARVPWTTSRVVGSPEKPMPYRPARVFPDLKFKEPVELVPGPGLDRWFIVELAGKISSFKKDGSGRSDLALDLKHSTYGLAFHPQFASNHFVYVCYVTRDNDPDGSRVSRFTLTQLDPPKIDPGSEQVLISWIGGGHNGGSLQFGPDGYLYISTGDAASPNPPDPFKTGQDISDLLSSILRIDVDHPEAGKKYRAPADNPFVQLAGARPEVWAYGLRNPWRMSFDRANGSLWTGDVGWELWEMVHRIERGGNYGWSITEGPQAIRHDIQAGPTPILPPIYSHPHSESASISGGYVYRGKKFPDLAGHYIYGDWVTGRIWGLATDGKGVTPRQLVTSTMQIICFGQDIDGELLVVDFGGGIYQLEKTPRGQEQSKFPRKLSQTGLFVSTARQTPSPGVIPYAINSELWQDGAEVARYIALPGASTIVRTNEGKWLFPPGAVLARTISMPGPRAGKYLETQLLHFDGAAWNAYTYQWNSAQTDATLVDEAGAESVLEIADLQAPGGRRRQTWRFHARAECMRCHNPWGGTALAFNPSQLDRTTSYAVIGGKSSADQLATLKQVAVLSPSLVQTTAVHLARPGSAEGLDARARSWLHANCAHCHREGAGGAVVTHFNIELKPAEMKAFDIPPTQGTFGLPAARVVSPGHPWRSALLYRISTLGPSHMPRIGSAALDWKDIRMIREWIETMPPEKTAADEAADRQEESARLLLEQWRQPGLSASRRGELLDSLLAAPSSALAALFEISVDRKVRDELITRGTTSANPLVRELFESFVPEEKRTRKLGPSAKPGEILSLRGDASRGRALFFQQGGPQCSQCHRIGNEGRDFGPDLSRIAQKYRRPEILDNILNPSKIIDPAFITYQVETADSSLTGFVVRRSAGEIVLKDATLTETRLKTAAVKSIEGSKQSAMPEGLLQTMTAQEAADLLEFLSSLK